MGKNGARARCLGWIKTHWKVACYNKPNSKRNEKRFMNRPIVKRAIHRSSIRAWCGPMAFYITSDIGLHLPVAMAHELPISSYLKVNMRKRNRLIRIPRELPHPPGLNIHNISLEINKAKRRNRDTH